MDISKLKRVKGYLTGGGFGFAASSVLGLDGFRQNLLMPQLIMGTVLVSLAVVLHFVINRIE